MGMFDENRRGRDESRPYKVMGPGARRLGSGHGVPCPYGEAVWACSPAMNALRKRWTD